MNSYAGSLHIGSSPHQPDYLWSVQCGRAKKSKSQGTVHHSFWLNTIFNLPEIYFGEKCANSLNSSQSLQLNSSLELTVFIHDTGINLAAFSSGNQEQNVEEFQEVVPVNLRMKLLRDRQLQN